MPATSGKRPYLGLNVPIYRTQSHLERIATLPMSIVFPHEIVRRSIGLAYTHAPMLILVIVWTIGSASAANNHSIVNFKFFGWKLKFSVDPERLNDVASEELLSSWVEDHSQF